MDKNYYDTFLIERYSHWELYLHEGQFPYLGRCYAAAIREDADMVTDMSRIERDELFDVIIPKWKEAVNNLFPFDRENIAIFGNDWLHLHAHLIPRRLSPIRHDGIDFIDPNPKGNYSPYEKQKLTEETLLHVAASIKSLIKK